MPPLGRDLDVSLAFDLIWNVVVGAEHFDDTVWLRYRTQTSAAFNLPAASGVVT